MSICHRLHGLVQEGLIGRGLGNSRFEVVDDETPKASKKAAEAEKATPVAIATAAIESSKKRKADTEPAAEGGKKLKNDKGEAVPKADAKKVEKKEEKKEKAKKGEKPETASSKKVTLPSGLVMEDVKVGDGPVAGKGKRCGMR